MDIVRHLERFLMAVKNVTSARRPGVWEWSSRRRVNGSGDWSPNWTPSCATAPVAVRLTAAGYVLMREAPELPKRHRRMRALVRRAAVGDETDPPRPWSEL